jgi:hypothetical protein
VLVRTQLKVKHQEPINQPCFHKWPSPDGAQWALFYRLGTDYLIRFVDFADFTISADAEQVFVCPVPGVPDDIVEHLYLNLVVPLALSHQNKLILHASAVEIDDFSVVFAAASGGGKSTLAASFATHGYRFLTDDGVQLGEEERAGYHVRPNHPSIRLWDDSKEQLISDGGGITSVKSSCSKSRFLAEDTALFCAEPRLLRHVYFLGKGDTNAVSIEEVSGREVIVNLLSHSFLLDVSSKPTLARNFRQIAQLAEQPIFYRLDYPRRYEVLPEVRERVINHAKAANS